MVVEAYKSGDKGVIAVLRRNLELIGVLINNINLLADPHKSIIHLYYIESEIAFDKVKAGVERIAGKEAADKLALSIIGKQNRFLAGCAIAIRKLFFDKGGFES